MVENEPASTTNSRPQDPAQMSSDFGISPPRFDWMAEDKAKQLKTFKSYCQLVLNTPSFRNNTGEQIVNYILLWLGPQGVEIFDTWNLSTEQQGDPAVVWDRFMKFFEPQSNFRLSRFQLRDMRRKKDESIDCYMTRMRTQAAKCHFTSSAHDDNLIDQLIIGTAHDAVRKRILEHDPEKRTLDTCVQYARTYEVTSSQLKSFHSQETSVDAVHQGQGKTGRGRMFNKWTKPT